MEFVKARMRGLMQEKGFSYDVIDAIISLTTADISDLLLRAQVIRDFKQASYQEDFMVVYNRANNLSKKWDSDNVDPAVLEDESEQKLYQSLLKLQAKVQKEMEHQHYEEAIQLLAYLRPELDLFFNAVMVMAEEDKLRAARLGLLKAIANLCNAIADFSKVLI